MFEYEWVMITSLCLGALFILVPWLLDELEVKAPVYIMRITLFGSMVSFFIFLLSFIGIMLDKI